MAAVSDLTFEAVRDFMILKGGKVTNHDLVKHFKNALTNPETRVQARNEFKEIVNTVATIVRSDDGEKYLVLKKKYRTPSLQGAEHISSPVATPELNPSTSMSSLYSLGDKRSMAHSTSQDSLDSATSPTRQPPPYRPPPPPVATTPPSTPVSDAPPVPPRKRSTSSNKENSPEALGRPTTIGAEADVVDESDPENKISVKECMQKFQRMASESALQKAHLPAAKKRFEKGGSDKDDDTHSVTSLDPKAREWMVKAAQSDYQTLFKLASENPRLARFKSVVSTRGGRLVREEPRRVRFDLPERRPSVGAAPPAQHGTRYLRGTLAGPTPAPTAPPLLAQARDSDDDGLRETLRRAAVNPLPEPTLNFADSSGRTALSYLASNGPVSLLEAILSLEGVDVNKPDNEGNTPLHFASQAGQVESVNYLLSRCAGIEVDARNNLGFTPLMKAAIQGRTKCAKLLLFAGASPTMRDTGRGLRAEQWARFCGRYVCADVIEKLSRHRLLERTTAYGRWGSEPELGPHVVQGRLQPPAISLINQAHQSTIKSRLKKAFRTASSPSHSFSLVTQLTTAALCASTPVLPEPHRVPPVIKSLIRPLAVPKVQVTQDDTTPLPLATKQPL